MNKKAPLLEELLKYHEEKNMILSMPGNKSGIGFLRDELGKKYINKLGFLDITEVDPLDNLHNPEGIIKEAQELLARTYKADKGYFIVNGSTAGNLASIFAAFNEGDEVIVERNCHKSIYNGLILRKLKVTYIEPLIDEKKGIFLPPDREKIYTAINKCNNPKGIILTYPNYFGISYDIEEVIKDLKKKGLKIIIDGAHGAHYGINKRLPKALTSLANYIVLSAHKTLPSLTQGSYLLVNDVDSKIDFYLKAFMTTSPSYLIMSSLDYARYYLDSYGEKDYEILIDAAIKWRDKINKLNKVTILDENQLEKQYEIDLSRYLMLLPQGHCGHKLLDYLRENKIQAEMSFSCGVVLILSPFNTEDDFEKVFNVINKLDLKILKTDTYSKYYSFIPKKILEPFEVFEKEEYEVALIDSIGKVAKEALVPYPPGIPLICWGEVITLEAINIINEYINNGRSVIGVENNKIKVIK